MRDIGSKIKASLMWNISLKTVFQVVRFVTSIIIARLLDPKDFGIMGLATMVIMYADNLTSVGFNRALIQRKDITETHINSVFTVNLSISLLFTFGIVLFSARIADFFAVPELRNVLLVSSGLFVVSTCYQVPMTLMKRHLDFKTVALTELFRGLLQSFITLFLALSGYKYWALVNGFIVSYVLSALYILIKVQWKPRIRYNHAAMKEVFSFGFWNFLRVQTSEINEYADKFIIGKFLGPVFLGFYEKAFSIVAIQKGNFTVQINSVMFSSFSRLQSESNDTIKKYLKKTLSLISLVTFPLNAGLAVLGDHFVLVLLGDKWEPMITALKILSGAFVFSSLSGLCSSLNMGTGDYVKQTLRECYGNILLIIFCLVAARNGIEYVAFGVLLVYAIVFFMTFQITRQKYEVKWTELVESIMPAAIGSLGMLACIILLEKLFLAEINAANFILLSVAGGLVYLMIIFLPRYPILEEYRSSAIYHMKNIVSRLTAFSKG